MASKQWYQDNKEKVRKQQKLYNELNKEKNIITAKAYCAKNKDKISAHRKIYKATTGLKVDRAWRKANLEKIRFYSKTQREKHPEKCRSRSLFREAVRIGHLERLPCHICDDPKSHGHHEDYSKPYEVFWLCIKHHALRHVELRTGEEQVYE